MATVQQIEEQRLTKGRIFFSICKICNFAGWNDYYGCDACRRCISFMLQSIKGRKCYSCSTIGQCWTDWGIKDKCDYCLFKKCYKRGMKTAWYGIHDDTYYMKEVSSSLVKVRPVEPLDFASESEMKLFKNFFDIKIGEFRNRLRLNPPVEHARQKLLRKEKSKKRCEINGTIMKIVESSLLLHDVIKMNHYHYDPYQCKIPQLQYLMIKILELIRKLRDVFPDGKINEEIKNDMIYYAGPRREDTTIPSVMHSQLSNISAWMEECYIYFDQY